MAYSKLWSSGNGHPSQSVSDYLLQLPNTSSPRCRLTSILVCHHLRFPVPILHHKIYLNHGLPIFLQVSSSLLQLSAVADGLCSVTVVSFSGSFNLSFLFTTSLLFMFIFGSQTRMFLSLPALYSS